MKNSRKLAPMAGTVPAMAVGHDETMVDHSHAAARARSRWSVHLAMLTTFILALVPLLLLGSFRVTVHVVIACVFLGLIIVHLAQRRHTLKMLIAQLAHAGSRMKKRRLAIVDAIFVILVANVLASGIFDLATGQNPGIELPGTGFIGWHSLSALLFLGHLITHVIRRRKRLRRSLIR
jgi:hypothetical protein